MGAAMSFFFRNPSLLDLLDWGQLKRAEGEAYLSLVEQFVLQQKDKRFVLKSRSGSGVDLRIAGIDDTMYRESTEEVDGWGMFYLPQEVKMRVFAVVEGPSCSCDQLVLMTCEDKKVYGYDGEDLHEVASNLKELCEEGFDYPASKSYYHGEAFKDIVRSGPLTTKERFLLCEAVFRMNALKIIKHMLHWSKDTPGSTHLVDEMLHSIFFLGAINKPKYEPKDTVGDEMLNMLKRQYPRPLECYWSQVPKRSPFSCVLDMIVLKEGQSEEEKIKKRLQTLAGRLESHFLVSTTMCITTSKRSKRNYYGVSMCTKRVPKAAKIMIAASSLSGWEECVAGAVITYYPENASKKSGETKKPYFDGTIKIPPHLVTCQAFSIKHQSNMEPCTFCRNLFGLPAEETMDPTNWLYGHCAEAESLSNLLKEEKVIKAVVKLTSTYTAEDRKRAEDSVRDVLMQLLRMVDFKWEFYQPQTS